MVGRGLMWWLGSFTPEKDYTFYLEGWGYGFLRCSRVRVASLNSQLVRLRILQLRYRTGGIGTVTST